MLIYNRWQQVRLSPPSSRVFTCTEHSCARRSIWLHARIWKAPEDGTCIRPADCSAKCLQPSGQEMSWITAGNDCCILCHCFPCANA